MINKVAATATATVPVSCSITGCS